MMKMMMVMLVMVMKIQGPVGECTPAAGKELMARRTLSSSQAHLNTIYIIIIINRNHLHLHHNQS